MLTWKLWRALYRPPLNHPLFRRAFHTGSMPWIAGILESTASLTVLPMVLFTGAVHSIGWSMATSSTIAAEHRCNTFDVLGAAPGGQLGASWSLCTACLYRHSKFVNANSWQQLSGRVVFLGILLFVAIRSGSFTEPSLEALLLAVVYAASLSIGMYLDHIQSIVLGCLIGMITPSTEYSKSDPAWVALFGFLMLEVTTCALALFVVYRLLPSLYTAFAVDGFVAELSVPLLGLLCFYLVRELLISRLWSALLRTLNANSAEFEALVN